MPEIVVTGRADLSRLNRGLATAAKGITAAVAVTSAAAAKLGVDSIKAASDAQQSLGATETVFGKYADTVIRQSNRAAQAIGLSANEYRELSNVLGASLAGAGVPLQKVTTLTGDLQKRAADMAATFGGTTREAIEAVSSALRGETDPIERYGVSIKASDVSARLAADGLDKLEGQALKTAEMQTRLGLIFEKTKGSAGAFSRESETLAGQQQRLGAQVDNLQGKLGTLLLPGLTRVTAELNQGIGPASKVAFSALNRIGDVYKAGGISGLVQEFDRLTGIDLAPYFEDVERGADSVRRIIERLAPAFGDAIASLPPFISPLELAADVLGVLADVAEAIPTPVASLAIQAGIAAAVLPRLAGAVSAVSTNMAVATTRAIGFSQALAASGTAGQARALGQLATAARGAAGVGGLLALSSASQQSNDKLKILGTTAGGALLGFSLGGPIGAAVGAGAGALYGLVSATNDSKEAMQQAIPVAGEYASTLDALTGATTKQTRARVFQQLAESTAITQARELGISTRDVVSAVLGQEGALQRVNTALNQAKDFTVAYADQNGVLQTKQFKTREGVDNLTRQLALQGIAYDDISVSSENAAKQGILDFIGRETDARINQTRAMREEIRASQNLNVLRGKIPPRIVTKLETSGIEPTVKGIARVISQYKLVDKKQIAAVIKASGVDTTVKQVRRVLEALEATGKAKGDLHGYVRGIEAGIRGGKQAASRGATSLVDLLAGGTRKARADLSGVAPSVRRGIGPAKSAATTGGSEIGNQLEAGIISGFASTQARLSSQAAAAVGAAIAAARARAKIKSPSRETAYIGEMLAKGFNVGFDRFAPGVEKGGRTLVERALSGITSGGQGVDKAIEKITDLIEKQIKAKNDKAETARERAVLRGLRDEFKLLKLNGKEQDRNTEKLKTARDGYRDLVQQAKDYASAIKDAVVANASVVGLGVNEETQAVTVGGITNGLSQKLNETLRFYQAIEKLRGKLNETSLQQLLDAGVSGGLATAEALAAGTAQDLANINSLTQQIAGIGGGLGAAMSNQFKRAGVQAAAGLVAGLESQQKKLDQVGERLGGQIAAAVRKALGIKGAGARQQIDPDLTETRATRDAIGRLETELRLLRSESDQRSAKDNRAADQRADRQATTISAGLSRSLTGAVSDGIKGRVPA